MSGYESMFRGSGSTGSVLRLMYAYDDIDPNWLEQGYLQLADGQREDFDVSDLEMFRLIRPIPAKLVEVTPQMFDEVLAAKEVGELDAVRVGVSRYVDDVEKPMKPVMGFFEDGLQWTKRRLDSKLQPVESGYLDRATKDMRLFMDSYKSLEEFYKDDSLDFSRVDKGFAEVGFNPAQVFNEIGDTSVWGQLLAVCIPPTEGKTTLVKQYPLWFEDCDDLLDKCLYNSPGMVKLFGPRFELAYRVAAEEYGNFEKILLTNSPGCVPSYAYVYTLLLCKCNRYHPHDGVGIVKPRDRGKSRKWNGHIWFFSSFLQRDMFVMMLARMKFQSVEGPVERYLKRV